MEKREAKKNWAVNSDTFRRLLEWLDENENSDGQKYLVMRGRLVNFFDRKNCLNAEILADETLDRVARRLEEEGTIAGETPARFCYITARFVFLENLRSGEQKNVPLDETAENAAFSGDADERENKEKLLVCLDQCTAKLDQSSRDLINAYYFGEERVKIENRRALAQNLGISANALTIRACRIRDKLETCVRDCAGLD